MFIDIVSLTPTGMFNNELTNIYVTSSLKCDVNRQRVCEIYLKFSTQ